MRLVIQRVTQASVDVDGREVARIGPGLVVLVGFSAQDAGRDVAPAAQGLVQMRIFDDDRGGLGRSLGEVGGSLLVVPQITLSASLDKGRRPSFDGATPAAEARALFERFVQALKALHPRVEAGIFQARMRVSLVNDGPVTFVVDEPR